MKQLILEFDDLNPHTEVNCLPLIDELVLRYPNVVLNFFTVASYGGHVLHSNLEWCKKLRTHIHNGNVCLAVHGLYHTSEEFKHHTYDSAVAALKLAHTIFNAANLPFTKVFRGPHWGINEHVFKALIDLGYSHVYSHESYRILNDKFKDAIKIIYYNWNGKDELVNPADLCIGHFHTHNVCGNGIQESFNRICRALDNNDFKYLRVDQAT